MHALPWHLPSVAASPDQIDAAERAAGFPLPEPYKAFLRHANGLKGFFVLVALFGTAAIVDGRARSALAQAELAVFLEGAGVGPEDAIAIGASDVERDVFILISPRSGTLPGGVIWWAGEEVDQFADFTAFFDAMIAYNQRIAETLGKQGRSDGVTGMAAAGAIRGIATTGARSRFDSNAPQRTRVLRLLASLRQPSNRIEVHDTSSRSVGR